MEIRRTDSRYSAHLWVAIFFVVLLLTGCGGSNTSIDTDADNGALVFNIRFNGNTDQQTPSAAIDCAGQGIATVEAVVYDPQDTLLVGGGPWACDIGQGVVRSVPPGSGRTIVILGKSSEGNLVFRGEKSGINIVANREHNVGTIDCFAFVPNLQAPTDGAEVKAGEMVLQWSDVNGAVSYRVLISSNSDLTKPIIDVDISEATYTPTGLSYKLDYFWQVYADDLAGNRGMGSPVWSYTTPENSSPVAKIIAPGKGRTYIAGEHSEFTGSGIDADDGALKGNALVWRSDVAGEIGTGETFSTSALEAGTHHITLIATDSAGSEGMDNTVVTVASTRWPDTGQVDSYTDTHGEDADYNLYQPSYTKLDINGNDLPDNAEAWTMVRDNVTSLIWEIKTDDGSIHDKNHRFNLPLVKSEFIDQLNNDRFGGYSDWRIPTVEELFMLVSHGKLSPPYIDTAYFPNTISSVYATITKCKYLNRIGWYVYFETGEYHHAIAGLYYFRAVRGGRAEDELLDNREGTVTDKSTGLMWAKNSSEQRMSWEEALIYCESLRLAGYDDWRLPNVNELQSIIDHESTIIPPLDPIFPAPNYFAFWSSTTCAYETEKAWRVYFDLSIVLNLHAEEKISDKFLVRAVRGGL